jgi:hypothetical protein
MNTTTAYPSASGNWFRRAEAWLDQKGRAAWIAAMVLGFIFFWPVGLGLLAYMIWGKRMFGKSCRNRSHGPDRKAWAENWDRMSRAARPSGNAAFDSYKADMLRRLEDEQEAFEAFLQRLREAKDKTEFDSFMDDRAAKAREVAPVASGDAPEVDARRGEY